MPAQALVLVVVLEAQVLVLVLVLGHQVLVLVFESHSRDNNTAGCREGMLNLLNLFSLSRLPLLSSGGSRKKYLGGLAPHHLGGNQG